MAVKIGLILLAGLLLAGQQDPTPTPPPETFQSWLARAIADARGRGFDDRVIDRTLVGLEPLPRVVESDRSQAELIPLTLDRYLASRITAPMVRRGREMARTHDALLRRLERTYGVPRQYLLAVWGVESRFGRLIGRTPVFQALATLAWEPPPNRRLADDQSRSTIHGRT